jgi:hypothetical protein
MDRRAEFAEKIAILSDNCRKVWDALLEASDLNGHDFAVLSDVHRIAARMKVQEPMIDYIAETLCMFLDLDLVETVDECTIDNDEPYTVTQIVIAEDALQAVYNPPDAPQMELLYIESHSEGAVYRITVHQDLTGFIPGFPFVLRIMDEGGRDIIELFGEYHEALTAAMNAAVADRGRVQFIRAKENW